MGKITYGPTKKEKNSLKFRRSIYVSKDIKAGEKFTKDNIKIVRPGYGLEPKHYETILGNVANKSLAKGTPLKYQHLF